MALQLNHVHLKTHDPEKTAQFYVETLGAKIVGKAGTNGYRLDLHGLSLNVTTFLESQTREQKYGMEHIAIDTDELDNLIEKLKAQRHQHSGANHHFWWKARVFLRGTGRRATRIYRDEVLVLHTLWQRNQRAAWCELRRCLLGWAACCWRQEH